MDAVENQPVSVALLERTGISLLLRPEIWACVPGSELAHIDKVRKTWKKPWQDQRQFCSGKVFEGKLPGNAAEVKSFQEQAIDWQAFVDKHFGNGVATKPKKDSSASTVGKRYRGHGGACLHHGC